jgi:putative endopeptidase
MIQRCGWRPVRPFMAMPAGPAVAMPAGPAVAVPAVAAPAVMAALVVAVAGLAGGCSSGSEICNVGLAECPCTPAGSCAPGLQCSAGRCLPSPVHDAAPRSDSRTPEADAAAPDGGPDAPPAHRFAVELTFLDRKTDPCTDFYQFACGGWMEQNPLRPGETWRRRRSAPSTEIGPLVVKLIEDAWMQRATSDSPETRAIGRYHQSCLAAPFETQSRATLKAILAMTDGIASLDDFGRVSAELRKRGAHALFLLYAGVDPGDPGRFILTVDQGARALGSREVYVDPGYATLRGQYKAHVQKLAGLLGVAIDGDAVLRVETALAQVEATLTERRDPLSTYNKLPLADAMALAPRFPWRVHLEALGFADAGKLDSANVRSVAYLRGVEAYLTSAPLEDLKHYLRWLMLENKAAYLDQPVLDEEFDFHGRLYAGRTSVPSRLSTCLGYTEGSYGMYISKRYVQQYFDARTRSEVEAMLVAVKGAFARRLAALTWLDAPTRMAAQAKLEAIDDKIGHPDEWPTITAEQPERPWLDEHLERSLAGYRGVVNALTGPGMPRRSDWSTTPITVNAFYRPAFNEIVFPAAILRPPYFDLARDQPGNYAAIGTILGHELTHGFDDSGRHYDGKGALRSWWTPTVDSEARKRSQCLADYFSKLEPVPGVFIDGALSLGENTADLGGVRLALEAYLASGQTAAPQFGFDARQQFFIGYGQLWCSRITPDLVRSLLASDTHAPDKQRVNGPLSHMPEFAEAFSCPAAAPMRAPTVCEIW